MRWSSWRANLRDHIPTPILKLPAPNSFLSGERIHARLLDGIALLLSKHSESSERNSSSPETRRICSFAVVDLYWENEATHQWIDTLKVPVELLSIDDYRSLFLDAGFANIRDQRILDPAGA